MRIDREIDLGKFAEPDQIIIVGQATEADLDDQIPVGLTYDQADRELDLTGFAGFRGFGDRWAPLRREPSLRDPAQNVNIKEVK